jgi:hypothetical protein
LILEKDRSLKFILYCYTLGKEEMACNLAKDYNTKIIINQERWSRMEAIGIANKFFIMDKDYDIGRQKLREEGMTDEEIQENNVEIHIRPIRERPQKIEHI